MKKITTNIIAIIACTILSVQQASAATSKNTPNSASGRAEISVRKIADGLKYDMIYDFSEGMAGVANKAYKWGYLDKKGNLIIPLIYEAANPFSESLAVVAQDGKYGYIDKTGKIVVPFIYDRAEACSDGMASVKTDKKWGYIDKTGNLAISCEYDQADAFSEGFAAVRKESNGKWGYIDKTGKTVVPFEYNRAHAFSEGLAVVSVWDGQYRDHYGYIDTTGRIAVPLEYELACDFSEGLGGVRKNGKTGYIDKTGKVVVPIVYDSHDRSFHEGLANVLKGGKWGYIDQEGRVAIPFQYSFADAFSDGMAVVSNDGINYGYIDKAGKLVLPYAYRYNPDMAFSDGVARVNLNDEDIMLMNATDTNKWSDKYGFIDKTGKFVIPVDLYGIVPPSFSEGMITIPKDGKWSILEITERITKEITATFGATRYILNGEPFDQDTLLYNDVAYLPAAYLAIKLGLTAEWNAASNTTTLTSIGAKPTASSGTSSVPAANPVKKIITAIFGATQYVLNGVPFDEQTLVYNDTAYLPAAYLATQLGLTATWDAATNITNLTSK